MKQVDLTGTGLYKMPPKTEVELVGEQADKEAIELLEERASLFTLREMFWLQHFINKLRWSTTLEREQKHLKDVQDLKKKIEKRKLISTN